MSAPTAVPKWFTIPYTRFDRDGCWCQRNRTKPLDGCMSGCKQVQAPQDALNDAVLGHAVRPNSLTEIIDMQNPSGTFTIPYGPAQSAPAKDNVSRPNHYARFVIEPITFINANKLPFNIGNVIKYACRYDAKNGIEDLRKAMRYLEIHIETLERDERVAGGEDARHVWAATL